MSEYRNVRFEDTPEATYEIYDRQSQNDDDSRYVNYQYNYTYGGYNPPYYLPTPPRPPMPQVPPMPYPPMQPKPPMYACPRPPVMQPQTPMYQYPQYPVYPQRPPYYQINQSGQYGVYDQQPYQGGMPQIPNR